MGIPIEVFLRTHISDLGGLFGAFITYIKVIIYNRIVMQHSGTCKTLLSVLFIVLGIT